MVEQLAQKGWAQLGNHRGSPVCARLQNSSILLVVARQRCVMVSKRGRLKPAGIG